MRIAFIVGCFPSLSETFILNQIVGLIERGHQVDIYADQQGDTAKVHPSVESYRLLQKTYYLPPVPEDLRLRVSNSLPLLIRYAYQTPVALLKSLNFLKYREQAVSLWLLYSVVPAVEPYDIIHAQFGTQSYRGMAFQTVNAPQAKLVTTFRGDDISRFVREKGDRIYERLFRVGDFFLVNCEFFQRRVMKLGCAPNKIVVHRSGLECSNYPFKPRTPPTDGMVRIATTGRLVEKKGIEYAIRAVAKQAKQTPIVYNIIGDGELRSNLQQLIDELHVGEFVKLLGWKTEQEIIEILDQTHIFIAPSVTAADGNQDAPVNVLKEAMAIGLPVISTLHGGIPELVEDGVSGFLVPERDAEALAAKLADLIAHPETWAQMGKAGRATVEKHYNLHHLNDRLAEIYEHLLERTPSANPLSQKPASSLPL